MPSRQKDPEIIALARGAAMLLIIGGLLLGAVTQGYGLLLCPLGFIIALRAEAWSKTS